MSNQVGKIHSFQVMRLIAAFFVICIHIQFYGKVGTLFVAYGKIAVPYFLVICGYFLYREDTQEFLSRLKKQIRKIFILTIAVNLGYLIYVLILYFIGGNIKFFFSDNFSIKCIKDFLLWNISPFGVHLWYLGSLLYALIIIRILCKLNIIKYAMFFSPILLSIYIYLMRTQSFEYYYIYRNAILCTLAYVMMGLIIRRYQYYLLKVNFSIYLVITIILTLLVLFERNLYHENTSIPYFSAELLVYFVVLLLLKVPGWGKNTVFEKISEKYTLFIYIVHMAVINLFNLLPNSLTRQVRAFAPSIIFIISLFFAILYYKITSMLKEHKILCKL